MLGYRNPRLPRHVAPLLALCIALSASRAVATVINVGPHRHFSNIAQAVQDARPGDVIKVWPLAGGRPYRRVAIAMNKPRITIESESRRKFIKINGRGFNYSGRGSIPRAIFQFNPGSSGCILRGFDLSGAGNHAGNGAGVRINAANNIAIRHCYIHNNQMGIMSNGSFARHSGARQVIENCHITRNGTQLHAGYNHNLYLGGTSVLVRGCDISHSLTGHNLKSRAHLTEVEYCYIHDSANRELDLVDARGTTDVPHSDALVLGCIIVKKPHISGNEQVINFGQDGGGNHTGTLYLVHNTIVTKYPAPIVTLSAPGARLDMIDNVIISNQHRATLVTAPHGPAGRRARGHGNQIPAAYGALGRKLSGKPLPWRKIHLPWRALHLRRQRLMRYVGVGRVAPRPGRRAGAGPLPGKR